MPEPIDADLAQKVIAVIAKAQRIPEENISIDSTFEELKIDSLDGINIVFALENEFGVEIPDDSVNNMRSVRDAVEGVTKLVAAKAEAPAGEPETAPADKGSGA